MAKYYAHISGAANVTTNFNPYAAYTGNGNYLRIEYNGDVTTNATANVYVWRQQSGNWFSFEQGSFKHYLNLGSTTYVPGVNNDASKRMYYNTNGFEETAIFELTNGTAICSLGSTSHTGTYSGTFPNGTIKLFPSSNASNLQMNFYEYKVYGSGNTLLFDFVPDTSGTTKGIRDKVSGNFFAASDQSKITLYSLTTFEVDLTEIEADYTGVSSSVTVTADSGITWTASTNDSWISLSNPTGDGNGTFTVVVSNNKTHYEKTGTVTVTSFEGDTISISIFQVKLPSIISQKPIYRSGNAVIKMYRSGELIYLKVVPAST